MNKLSSRLALRAGAVAAVSAVALTPAAAGLVSGAAGSAADPSSGGGTALVSATASPAVGSVTVKDAHGDMLGHGADIFRVRVVNDSSVRVVVQHDNLVRSFRSGSSGTVYLDTDRSTRGPDFALVAGLYEGADYALLRTDGWRIRYNKPAQGSYEMRLAYDTDRTRIDIGRRTLGRPAEVRVAVHTAGALDNHTVDDWMTGQHRFTPWVKRG